MVEGVRLGSIDGSAPTRPTPPTVGPELGLFSVAYLFKDLRTSSAWSTIRSSPRASTRSSPARTSASSCIGFYSAGVRNIYSRKGSVTSPDDLKGVKIRVQNNPVEVKVWKHFGAIPTPMNFGEVYQALQSGVLDAAENGLAVIESNRHNEAAKYISLTEHQRTDRPCTSTRRSCSLPPDLQNSCWRRRARPPPMSARRTRVVADAADRLKARARCSRGRTRPSSARDRADPGRGRQGPEGDGCAARWSEPPSSAPLARGNAFSPCSNACCCRCSPRCWRSSRWACSSRSCCATSSPSRSCGARSCRCSPSSGACTWAQPSALAAHALRVRSVRGSLRGRAAGVQRLIVDLCVLLVAGDGRGRLEVLAVSLRACRRRSASRCSFPRSSSP